MIPEELIPKAQRLYDLAKAKGYSHASAIGVCANVMAESSFNEGAHEASGGGGFGLGQWTPASNLYAQGTMLGYTTAESNTFDVQCDILLRGDETGQWSNVAYNYDPLVVSPQTLNQFKNESNIMSATMNYMAHWERPNEDPEINHKERRKQYASDFDTRLNGTDGGGVVYPHLPVTEGTPITDVFGNRINPVTGEWELHNGTDWGGQLNDPVFATMSGVVVVVGYDDPYRGNWVMIKHDSDRYYSKYLHLNSTSVVGGQRVTKGQEIGKMGTTGQSTGVHLHFTISTTPEGETDGGSWIDPEIYLQTGQSDGGGTNKGMSDLIQMWLSGALNGWGGM